MITFQSIKIKYYLVIDASLQFNVTKVTVIALAIPSNKGSNFGSSIILVPRLIQSLHKEIQLYF